MVGVPGIEPGTSSLSGTRSNQLSYTPGKDGGGSRSRTGDIQLAKLALYQLSYAPGRRAFLLLALNRAPRRLAGPLRAARWGCGKMKLMPDHRLAPVSP